MDRVTISTMKLFLAVTLCGCSILAVPRVPPDWSATDRHSPVCDQNPGGPVLVDAAISGLAIVSAIVGFSIAANKSGTGGDIAIGVTSTAVAIGFGYSAIIGHRRGVECRAAYADYANAPITYETKAELRSPTGFWCFTGDRGTSSCGRSLPDCRVEAGIMRQKGFTIAECFHVDDAHCFEWTAGEASGSACALSDEWCVQTAQTRASMGAVVGSCARTK